MKFEKYQKVIKLGRSETRGIENGLCHIFPKLDGTNGSVWFDSETQEICAGSRNKQLSTGSDNAGFYKYVQETPAFKDFFKQYPEHRLYGEFLVPHSFRGYKDDAWNKFYVFDVVHGGEYVEYHDYKPVLEAFGIHCVPLIDSVHDLPIHSFQDYLEDATFLVDKNKVEEDYGEGIVIKNYHYYNQFGNKIWAKVISPHFSNGSTKKKNTKILTDCIEDKIINEYCDAGFVQKEYAKIVTQIGGEENWTKRNIPQLLGVVYHEFLTEELPTAIKKHKNPTIDFKILNTQLNNKVKEVKSELF